MPIQLGNFFDKNVMYPHSEWHCRECNVFHGKGIGDAGRDGHSASDALHAKASDDVRRQRGAGMPAEAHVWRRRAA